MAAGLPQVRQALSDDPLCDTLFRRLDRAAHWTRGRLSADRVAALYGEKVAMSASRMDQYQSCHFAYFLRYGLGAKDRRPAGFHAPEYGTFVHFVLETVLREVRAQGGVARVSQEAVQACTARAVEDYVARELGGMEHQTPRFRYLFRRLERNVRAVVDNVVAELQASDFQPVLFELGFGPGKELPPVEITEGGVTLRISGFVDRVDGWVKDGRLYLRVVDYKTGRKSFDLTEVWHGLGLQMLLYLFTLEEEGTAFSERGPYRRGSCTCRPGTP
ncbi:MAG: PD-(D/E)XK nuclease family protein [Evtepia gabavorous]